MVSRRRFTQGMVTAPLALSLALQVARENEPWICQ